MGVTVMTKQVGEKHTAAAFPDRKKPKNNEED